MLSTLALITGTLMIFRAVIGLTKAFALMRSAKHDGGL